MKYFILITFFLFQYTSRQEVKLEGNYSMYFEEDYKTQNGIISFSNNTYKRNLLSGKEVIGTIKNEKFRILLKDNDTSFEMIIIKSKVPNDTIPFRTIDTRIKATSTGDIIIHEGKLIKIK